MLVGRVAGSGAVVSDAAPATAGMRAFTDSQRSSTISAKPTTAVRFVYGSGCVTHRLVIGGQLTAPDGRLERNPVGRESRTKSWRSPRSVRAAMTTMSMG